MELTKNTPETWDNVWDKNPFSSQRSIFHVEKEKKSLEWKRIKKRVLSKFGSFKGLKVIELGAGQGNYSLLFALEGAEVTLLDYSQKAINLGKLFFKKHNQKAKFILGDALDLDKSLISGFDVSISVGVAEHFKGRNRLKIIQSHFDVLRKGGIFFISVPNKWNPQYRIHKFLSELFGRWIFGEEYPFSILEFKRIGRRMNKEIDVIGGHLLPNFFLLKNMIKKFLNVREDYDIKNVKTNVGTLLDKFFGKYLIAISEK